MVVHNLFNIKPFIVSVKKKRRLSPSISKINKDSENIQPCRMPLLPLKVGEGMPLIKTTYLDDETQLIIHSTMSRDKPT